MWGCAGVQGLANTIWGFATLRHSPGGAALNKIAEEMHKKLEAFKPQVIIIIIIIICLFR
jgi:hypothetical protein